MEMRGIPVEHLIVELKKWNPCKKTITAWCSYQEPARFARRMGEG